MPKKSVESTAPEQAYPPDAAPTSDDLDRLRDILFGQQARTTDIRLTDLEKELSALRRDLPRALEDKMRAVDANHLSLSRRLDEQAAHQSEQAEMFAAEFIQQLQADRQALNEQLQRLEAESRQRHEQLSQEIRALLETLSAQKVSRDDLSQALLELSQRLKSDHSPV